MTTDASRSTMRRRARGGNARWIMNRRRVRDATLQSAQATIPSTRRPPTSGRGRHPGEAEGKLMPITNPSQIVVHEAPVWRDRADVVLRVPVPDAPDGKEWSEQLWARRVGDSRFEVCCIPVATYGYALGDVVEAPEEGPAAYTVSGVAEAAGHAVLRVWLAESSHETWDELQRLISAHGLLWEFRRPALVAVDLADPVDRGLVEAELHELEVAGRLRYEIGSAPYKRDDERR
jgi:hypothetical protein